MTILSQLEAALFRDTIAVHGEMKSMPNWRSYVTLTSEYFSSCVIPKNVIIEIFGTIVLSIYPDNMTITEDI